MRNSVYFVGGVADGEARAFHEGRVPESLEVFPRLPTPSSPNDEAPTTIERHRYTVHRLNFENQKPIYVAIGADRDLRTELLRVFVDRTTVDR